MSKSPKATCLIIGVPCSSRHQSTMMLSGFKSRGHNQRKLLEHKIRNARRGTYMDPILVMEPLHGLANAPENLLDCGLRKVLVILQQGQQRTSEPGIE